MKFQYFILLIFAPILAFGQTIPEGTSTTGLKAYYTFDNCDGTDDTGNLSTADMIGTPDCNCGVRGSALELDGVDDYLVFLGSGLVNTYFDDDDFTLSFYYKNYSTSPRTSLFSKRVQCDNDLGLDVRLQSFSDDILCEFDEDADRQLDLTIPINPERCWQHIVITRRNSLFSAYLDGELVASAASTGVLNINNSSALSFSNSPCIGSDGTARFRGLIDELAIYDEAITPNQVSEMYLPTDQILTRDTILFLGDSIQTYTANTCATSFAWTPTTGVSDPTARNPILSPTDTITYTLAMTDDEGCTTLDRVTINVIDPDLLDCDNVFLPKAFSPNGDTHNETYGISNPLAIADFVSFDIYSRWGGRVFSANTKFDQWDGTYNGARLNAGIFVYQLRYQCNGTTQTKAGSITLIR